VKLLESALGSRRNSRRGVRARRHVQRSEGDFDWPWKELPDWTAGQPVEPTSLGTRTFPSIWLQAARKKRADGQQMQLHWDGNNDKVRRAQPQRRVRNRRAAAASSTIRRSAASKRGSSTSRRPRIRIRSTARAAARGATLYAAIAPTAMAKRVAISAVRTSGS
jgi:hypothetical protein